MVAIEWKKDEFSSPSLAHRAVQRFFQYSCLQIRKCQSFLENIPKVPLSDVQSPKLLNIIQEEYNFIAFFY
jgi:hypothetical protein